MARILGLDLGSHSVKCVILEGGGRTFQTRRYYEVLRPQEGDKLDTLRLTLDKLIAEHAPRVDQLYTALPGPALATHTLTLPFIDTKRIEAALPFEVESQLPFEISEALFDYQPVGQDDKKTDMVVAVVKKDELLNLLQVLQDVKLDPRVITHPAVAYQNTLMYSPALFASTGPTESVCILDIGHERTQVTVGVPGKGLELARTIFGGGKDLTRAIANEFKTSFEDAAAWKEQNATLITPSGSPEVDRAAGALVRGLQPLLREIRPTIKSFSARTHRTVSRIYLCGGTAKLPGLEAQLAKDLGIPVELLSVPNESQNVIPPESVASASLAFALCLRAQTSARGPRLNLRRGDIAFKGDFDYVRQKAGILSAFAATLIFLIVVSGIVRNIVLSDYEKKVDNELCAVTQRVLGRCERNYDLALNLLQGKESPAAAIPKRSAVNLLAELAQKMPVDAKVNFDQIVVDLDRLQLRGETDSSKTIDKLVASMKTHRCFKEIKEGKIERSKDGARVTFRLDVQVACPDTPAPAQG
jgi:general secretion pathway protein L